MIHWTTLSRGFTIFKIKKRYGYHIMETAKSADLSLPRNRADEYLNQQFCIWSMRNSLATSHCTMSFVVIKTKMGFGWVRQNVHLKLKCYVLWKRQFGFFGNPSHRQSLDIVLCRGDRMGQLQSIVHRRSRTLKQESFPDLCNFPPEVAVCVLSHLNATDLCLAACVWKHLADNELLWQRYSWRSSFSFLLI